MNVARCCKRVARGSPGHVPGAGVGRAALWWLVLVAKVAGDAENGTLRDESPIPPDKKPQAVSKPHGFHIPTAPYPRRWNGVPANHPSRRAAAIREAEQLLNNLTRKIFRYQYTPVHRWRGLSAPTPLGPYSQRRLLKPLPPPPPELLDTQDPLALRDLNPAENDRNDNLTTTFKPVPWYAADSWQGARDSQPGRLPSPDELKDQLPPSMSGIYGRDGRRQSAGPNPDAEQYAAQTEAYSEESSRITKPSTTEKPSRVFLWRPPATAPLPELLDEDDTPLVWLQLSSENDSAPDDSEFDYDEAPTTTPAPAPPRPDRRSGQPRAAPYFSNSSNNLDSMMNLQPIKDTNV